jgi:putative transposase
MRGYGNQHVVITDKCSSYRAAMNMIGNAGRQATGRHLNNQVSHSRVRESRRSRLLKH